uniref:Lipoprotein n=1 Tax=uncultured bacterium Contig1722 TaxID=1393494 RepID=W0FVR7_9BACT|nr:hypothetical protein [uncultured bacterium Contig1722]
MKLRILMALVVLTFTVCVACKAIDFPLYNGDENITYEEIELAPSQGFSEEEKQKILNEYLENMFAKDIMTYNGVLGCKVNLDIDINDDTDNTVTVQYFYNPEVIDDVAALDDSIEELLRVNIPDAEVINVKGTPLSHKSDEEMEFVESNDIVNTLPADLDINWNYIPVVPN